jgi:hypothetical protein
MQTNKGGKQAPQIAHKDKISPKSQTFWNPLSPTNLYLIPSVTDQTHLSSTHLSPISKQLKDTEPIPTFQENRVNPKQKSVLHTKGGSLNKKIYIQKIVEQKPLNGGDRQTGKEE